MQRKRHTGLPTPLGAATRWFGTAAVLTLAGALSLAIPMAGRASAAQPTAASGSCWVRFAHFASGQGAIRISIDGKVVSAVAKFEMVTPYQVETAGPVTIKITGLGKPSFQLTDNIKVLAGGAVTVAALNGHHGLMFRTFDDNLTAAPAGDAKVRAVDADAKVHSLSVTFAAVSNQSKPAETASTSKVVHGVGYATASPYLAVPAGHYNVTIRNHTGKTVLVGKDWPVSTGTVASLVVVKSKGVATLEVLDDAAGATAAPTGGMQTGFGGTSLPSSHGNMGFDALIALTGLLLVGAMWRRFSVTDAVRLQPLPASVGTRRRRKVVASAAGFAVVTAVGGGCGLARDHGDATRAPAEAPSHVVAEGAPQASVAVPVPTTAAAPAHVHVRAHHHRAPRTPVTHLNLSKFGTGPTTTAAPTAIAIPAIGVQASMVTLGRNADGTAQVPSSISVAGWYDQGPAPGQRGPAVILGHVDSIDGPGVFYKLKDLTAGDTILVTEQGKQLTFEVQQVSTYDKTAFPTEAVFGPTPTRALRLVTCGGPFDYSTGHYYDNVVVYAAEIDT